MATQEQRKHIEQFKAQQATLEFKELGEEMLENEISKLTYKLERMKAAKELLQSSKTKFKEWYPGNEVVYSYETEGYADEFAEGNGHITTLEFTKAIPVEDIYEWVSKNFSKLKDIFNQKPTQTIFDYDSVNWSEYDNVSPQSYPGINKKECNSSLFTKVTVVNQRTKEKHKFAVPHGTTIVEFVEDRLDVKNPNFGEWFCDILVNGIDMMDEEYMLQEGDVVTIKPIKYC